MFKYSLNGREMSLDELIGEVKKSGDELPEKAQRIGEIVTDEIVREAKVGFNGAEYDVIVKPFSMGATSPAVSIEKERKDDKVTSVVAYGKEAVFVEFGAGVYFNGPAGTSPHPWGDKGPYYIGEYGEGKGKRKVWYFYDDNGYLRATLGTPASMPLYHATEDVKQRIPEIAREVFEGGDGG